MKFFIFSLFFLTISVTVFFAQTPGIIWETSYDHNEQIDIVYGATTDSQGNIIAACYTRDNADFYEFLTVKFDSLGNYIWHKTWNSGFTDGSCGMAVACDNLDNIIVTGGDHTLVQGDYQTVKYDPDGNLLWERYYDSGQHEAAEYVATDANDNIFIIGTRQIAANADWYIIKYDSAGTELWNDSWDGGFYDAGIGIAAYKDSFFTAMGCSFDSTQTYGDFVVNFYNSSGNIIWTRRFDNGNHDIPRAVAFDSTCNLILTGATTISGGYDFLTIKYDKYGSILWLKTLDYSTDDIATDISIDNGNNIILSGRISSYPNRDWFSLKYDSIGNLIWTTDYDYSGGDDHAHGVAIDKNGNPIIAGTCFIDSVNKQDFYLIKYTSDPVGVESEEKDKVKKKNLVTVEPNPFVRTAILKSKNSERVTIYDSSGRMIMKQQPGILGENLRPGIYFLKSETSDPVKIIKLK